MADVVPKIKLYIFLSICVILLNLSVIIVQGFTEVTQDIKIEQETTDININTKNVSKHSDYVIEIATLLPTGFLPFSSIIVNALFFQNAFPMNIIIGLIVGIISAIQLFIIIMVVLSLASNLLWHPDV